MEQFLYAINVLYYAYNWSSCTAGLHAVSGFNKRKYYGKYRCMKNKETASQAAGVRTKRNIAVAQDVYDYGTLTLLDDVSIFTVLFRVRTALYITSNGCQEESNKTIRNFLKIFK